MTDKTEKTYLGDGAFVQHGSYRGEIVLTTEDGVNETNRVVLDNQGLRSLIRWLGNEKLVAVTVKMDDISP